MNKLLFGLVALCLLAFSGCSFIRSRPRIDVIAEKGSHVYSGPKVGIIVNDFEIQTPKAASEVGIGLKDMLIAGLTNNRRFSIVERKAALSEAGDIIVRVVLSEFDPISSGGSSGVGGGGGIGNGRLGGLLGAVSSKAYISLEIQVIDAATSQALGNKQVQGQASDTSGVIMKTLGNWELSPALAAYRKMPMEKAIRMCIIGAVRYIVEVIPEKYYMAKGQENG